MAIKDVQETDWAKRTVYDNGVTLTRNKKVLLNTALVIGGTAVMYGIGRLVGEGLDHVPYLQQWIPNAVDYVSGINIQGNIDGLMGLLGGLYGLNNSGIKLNKETLTPREIN